jgi:O-methyltransferase
MRAVRRPDARRALYRASRAVPYPLRRILRASVGRVGVEDVVPPATRAAQTAEGFVTLSPSTPSGLLECLRLAKAADLGGSYYEFGLYRGYTLWFAQRAADSLGLTGMRFHGFDSFAGLPEVTGIDASTGEFATGDYACSREEVEGLLDRWGFDWSRGDLTAGLFSSLDPSLRPREPACVVLVDCDLYASTLSALAYLAPLLQDGTILLFDDWSCFGGSPEHGERKAFSEFMASHPEWRSELLFEVDRYGQAIRLGRSDR